MNEEEILRHIALGYEYSYAHDDWTTPLGEVLDGLTAEQALRTPSDGKCIWEIVLHLALWNEDIVGRVRTGQRVSHPEGSWPLPPDRPGEAEWMATQRRLTEAVASVQRLLESTSLEEIANSPYGLADVLCRLTHNGYHIGQMTVLRAGLS